MLRDWHNWIKATMQLYCFIWAGDFALKNLKEHTPGLLGPWSQCKEDICSVLKQILKVLLSVQTSRVLKTLHSSDLSCVLYNFLQAPSIFSPCCFPLGSGVLITLSGQLCSYQAGWFSVPFLFPLSHLEQVCSLYTMETQINLSITVIVWPWALVPESNWKLKKVVVVNTGKH